MLLVATALFYSTSLSDPGPPNTDTGICCKTRTRIWNTAHIRELKDGFGNQWLLAMGVGPGLWGFFLVASRSAAATLDGHTTQAFWKSSGSGQLLCQ